MSQIIDWEYYNSHFPNPVPESSFDAVEAQAEVELNKVVPSYVMENVPPEKRQDCAFQLCNFLYAVASGGAGSGLSSVSNDGYSESYAIKTREELQAEKENIIFSCIGTRLAGAF